MVWYTLENWLVLKSPATITLWGLSLLCVAIMSAWACCLAKETFSLLYKRSLVPASKLDASGLTLRDCKCILYNLTVSPFILRSTKIAVLVLFGKGSIPFAAIGNFEKIACTACFELSLALIYTYG